jgi:hypothetical protein
VQPECNPESSGGRPDRALGNGKPSGHAGGQWAARRARRFRKGTREGRTGPTTLSSDCPLGEALDVFVRREDAERFIEEVRRDEPELASNLRIEERELEAGGLN